MSRRYGCAGPDIVCKLNSICVLIASYRSLKGMRLRSRPDMNCCTSCRIFRMSLFISILSIFQEKIITVSLTMYMEAWHIIPTVKKRDRSSSLGSFCRLLLRFSFHLVEFRHFRDNFVFLPLQHCTDRLDQFRRP